MAKLFIVGICGYMLALTAAAMPTKVIVVFDDSASIVPFIYSPADELPTFVVTMAPLPVAFIADQVGSYQPVRSISLPVVPVLPKQHVRYMPRGGLLKR